MAIYYCRTCHREAGYPHHPDPERLWPGEERYSLGIYAGIYCDAHWKTSGYRDEPASAFDPMDAGEAYSEEDYA